MNFGIYDTFCATQYNYLYLLPSDPDTEAESDSDTQSVVSLAGHVNNRLGRLLGYRCGSLELPANLREVSQCPEKAHARALSLVFG